MTLELCCCSNTCTKKTYHKSYFLANGWRPSSNWALKAPLLRSRSTWLRPLRPSGSQNPEGSKTFRVQPNLSSYKLGALRASALLGLRLRSTTPHCIVRCALGYRACCLANGNRYALCLKRQVF